MRRFLLTLLLLLPLGLATACEGTLGNDEPLVRVDSVVELGAPTSTVIDFPSAWDMISAVRRRPELSIDAQNWDLALRQSAAGAFTLRPSEEVQGVRGAGIFRSPEGFDQIDEAPTSSSSYQTDPIALEEGGVYVARSRLTGVGCVGDATLLVLDLVADSGLARFRIQSNLGCNDERLTAD